VPRRPPLRRDGVRRVPAHTGPHRQQHPSRAQTPRAG
jgi:hypothetical protein